MANDIAKTKPPANALTPADMLKIAVEQGADLDKLEKLMDLQHRWESDQARKAYNEAVANFKMSAPRLVNTTKGNFGLYSNVDSITQKLTPALAKWGLTHSWQMSQDADRITVTCRLSHLLGHCEEVSLSAPPDDGPGRNKIQAIKSSTTYLSRITLLGVTGLATGVGDDDGQAAGGDMITAEQKDTLVALLKESGTNTVKFLEWLGVPTLDETPARRFVQAEKTLKRKLKMEISDD